MKEQRPIKFRAFQKTHDGKGQMINNYCYLDKDNHFNAEDLTNNSQGDIVSVMQFTGLTDKAGKEIYEGDTYKGMDGNTYHVYFKGGAFCGGKSFKDSTPLAWKGGEGEETEEDNTTWLEVIGNIYQPELK